MTVDERRRGRSGSRLLAFAGDHRRLLGLALLLLGSAVILHRPLGNAWLAGRLLFAVRSVAAGDTGKDLGLSEEKVAALDGQTLLEALVYRIPNSPPERAVVLVPGISELGCYHPRLMALSRHLASAGFLVVTPDIRMFREFRMSPQAIEQIVFWFRRVPALDTRVRKTGLAGISFSATLAVIAAASPSIRHQVAFIFGIGAYDDPLRCSRDWFAAGPVTVGPGYYPTRFYAKWIIMLAALDLLPDEDERRFLEKALVSLLLQKQIPDEPKPLSAAGSRWYRLALMREDQSDPVLSHQIEQHLSARLYAAITPAQAAPEIRSPVFLVHGAYDDLIPAAESRNLGRRFVNARTHVLISPFLTHTHPAQEEPGRWEKAGAVLEIALFFYRFAREVR